MRVTLDFETASDVDLSEVGSWVYWEHPSTEVLCLCWIDEPWGEGRWIPGVNNEALEYLRDLAADPSVIFEAHKADFEMAGWHYVMVGRLGLPSIPIERWDDTQARCYYRGLPGALAKVEQVLALDEPKDVDGRALTLSLSKPQTMAAWMTKKPEATTQAEWKRHFVKGTYDRSHETLDRVARYCIQDCRTEIAVGHAVGPLSAYERRVWELDQRMNQRGLKIGFDYVRASQAVVAEASRPLLAEFDKLTGGIVPTQVKALTAWCNANGLAIDSLAKDNLAALGIRGLDEDAEEIDDDDGEGSTALSVSVGVMPEHVRRVLSIRAVLGSTSIKKLDRMLACAGADGRVRYTIQYHGAGTGRWAGRLFQPQNFPRGKIEGGHDPDALVDAILYAGHSPRDAVAYLGCVFGDPIAAVASGLRHALVASPDNLFCTGDFAGIESRVVLALAGQHDKTALMASGVDVYFDFAEDIYGVPKGTWVVRDKDLQKKLQKELVPERQSGKGGVLGCGFGCGPPNFNEKFLGGRDLDLAIKIVGHYRKVWAPEVPKLWKALEQAAFRAVVDKGRAEAYGIVYEWHPGWLACHIPDGQTMWYRDPQFCRRPMPWDNTDIRNGWSYWAMKNGHWKRVYAYGGLLTENVVQKIARGLLCEAMFRLDAEGYPLVLTVHDECMSEVPGWMADAKAYEQIMAEPTHYSREIRVPIAVEGWSGGRYRK